jgi:hypothetical protein
VVATVTVTVGAAPDVCTTFFDPFMAFEGLDASGLGVSAWNSTGGAEAAAEGHDQAIVHAAFAGVHAYYYLATRDYVEAGVSAGAYATSFEHLPLTQAALVAGGYTIDEIGMQFGLLSLGADVQGSDWFWSPPVETRLYQGSTTFLVTLDGEDLVSAPMTLATVWIDYSSTPLDFAAHQISGASEPLVFSDASGSSSAGVQLVAAALLADLSQTDGIVIGMDTLQSAVQGDFGSEGRTGAHFDMKDTYADPVCD